MKQKHETFPQPKEAKWALFSMGDVARIEYYLSNFPTHGDVALSMNQQKACSSTLIWSGTSGNNVPVSLFQGAKLGFVLNPELIDVPHAEFVAYRTGSLIPKEVKKDGIVLSNDYGSTTESSKFPEKKGRRGMVTGQDFYTTNHAKWARWEGDKGTYHDKGSAERFAQNVWRRYYKPKGRNCGSGEMALNEALVIQKDKNLNPIQGIFWI
jgi:hypothetical protein